MDEFPENFRAGCAENNLENIREMIMNQYKEEGLPMDYYHTKYDLKDDRDVDKSLQKDHELLTTIKEELEERGFTCTLDIDRDCWGIGNRVETKRWVLSIKDEK